MIPNSLTRGLSFYKDQSGNRANVKFYYTEAWKKEQLPMNELIMSIIIYSYLCNESI